MTERSVLAAVSGIDANQTWLDSIGNNIANADTIGYKDSEVQFQDLLAEQLNGATAPTASAGGANPLAIGSGVQVAANEVNLAEGSLASTGNPNDIAITGSGYFVVSSGGQNYYTRNGSLTTDANGDLTTQEGSLIQGWQADGAGAVNTNAPISNIKIPLGETIGATSTTSMTIGGNLPVWNGAGTPPAAQTTTYDAYDSLGNPVPITMTFTPVNGAANQWSIVASDSSGKTIFTADATFTNGQISGLVSPAVSSTVAPDGTVSAAPAAPTNATTLTGAGAGPYTIKSPVSNLADAANFPAAPPGNAITFSFPVANSQNALTQYNSASTVQFQSQPTGGGYASGTLQTWSVGDDGTITGAFSNGQTLTLGQIALADFANPSGLTDTGNGLFATSANSGQAQVGAPGTGGRSALAGGKLEQSNVDLGTELTELITAQEAYTANTKTLTTSSNVIQALEAVQ